MLDIVVSSYDNFFLVVSVVLKLLRNWGKVKEIFQVIKFIVGLFLNKMWKILIYI